MEDMQDRIHELTHSLAYHRQNHDRMQILEGQLLQVERERIDLMRSVQEFERKAKLFQHNDRARFQGQLNDRRTERHRKEGDSKLSAENVEDLFECLERLNSLPTDAFSSLSLDQVTVSIIDLNSVDFHRSTASAFSL